jgi:hypothetical protein
MRDAATEAGGQAELIVYERLDHPGILQALALERRERNSVFQDTLNFARRVTVQESARTGAGG